jgi:hypothetical protein
MDICKIMYDCFCKKFTTSYYKEQNEKMTRFMVYQLGRQRNIMAGLIKLTMEKNDNVISDDCYSTKLKILYESLVSQYMNNLFIDDSIIYEADSCSVRVIKPKRVHPKLVVVQSSNKHNNNTIGDSKE